MTIRLKETDRFQDGELTYTYHCGNRHCGAMFVATEDLENLVCSACKNDDLFYRVTWSVGGPIRSAVETGE